MYYKNIFSSFSNIFNAFCSAHIPVAERAVSSATCIVIIVVGRRLRGITVCEPLGPFGSANVTSTDVSFDKLLGECINVSQ
jgi:hypothetical protein